MEQKKSHPPIPPGCDDILEFAGEWCLKDDSCLVPLKFVIRDASNPMAMSLHVRRCREVQSRCRCAWLDEAERISQTAAAEGKALLNETNHAWMTAKCNAEAWYNIVRVVH